MESDVWGKINLANLWDEGEQRNTGKLVKVLGPVQDSVRSVIHSCVYSRVHSLGTYLLNGPI